MHGLKCQRLEVGDVCISLMQKERHYSNGQEAPPVSQHNEESLNLRTTSGSSSCSSSSTSSASSSLSSPPPAVQSQHAHSQQQQQQEEPQNLSRKPSPMKTTSESRGLIEGTTHHPSLTSTPSNNTNTTTSTTSHHHNAPQTHSMAKGTSSSSSESGGSGRGGYVPPQPQEIPQPLHALVHAHLNHAATAAAAVAPPSSMHHSLEHSSSNGGSSINTSSTGSLFRNGQGMGDMTGNGGVGGNPLMSSFLSTIKHNYLAAYEAAKAAVALNGAANAGGANGLSHSIKNIVMGDSGYPQRQFSPHHAHHHSHHGGSPGVNGSGSPPVQSNGSSKRRYSAPDNVFGDNGGDIGGAGGGVRVSSREGRMGDCEEPPKKIASH